MNVKFGFLRMLCSDDLKCADEYTPYKVILYNI